MILTLVGILDVVHVHVSSLSAAGFKSKKIRVNLNLPIKAEVKAESTDVLKTVDEDRKYVIQATIVRYASVQKEYQIKPLTCL